MRKILIWTVAFILLAMPVIGLELSDIYAGYYMNGTANMIDVSGNSFDFTEAGTIDEFTPGIGTDGSSRGVYLANEKFSRPAFSFHDVTTEDWSMLMRISKTGSTDTETIWLARESGSFYWIIEMTNAGDADMQMNGCTVQLNTGGWVAGVHYNLLYAYNGSTRNMTTYLNGTYADSCIRSAGAAATAGETFGLPDYAPTVQTSDETYIGEVVFWNWTLHQSHATELQTSFLPFTGPPPPPSTGNLTLTNYDYWNGTQIINFNAVVNGTTLTSNASGIIEVDFLYNNTAQLDILINSTGYRNRSYLGYSPNISGSLEAMTYQAILCLNATAKVSGASVTPDNYTIGGNTSTSCFNITAGTHNVQAQLSGWYDRNQTLTVTAQSNTTQTVQNMSYANLTIYAIDGNTNESLSGYDLNINSITYTSFGESASSVTNHSLYLINDTYNITIDVPGYAVTTSLANVTVEGHTNYTFTLYKSNSISITILDEITNSPILQNITIRWTSNTTTWENTTDTSELFVYNISSGNYTLLFYGSNYSTRTYQIAVANDSTQFLVAYMIASTYSTIFTVKDVDTGVLLADVSMTMYKLVNSTWSTVESKLSDITGKAQFYYDPIGSYRFYLARVDYEDYVFYLNPILFSSYDVFMTKSDLLNYTVDYDDISIIYSPHTFENEQNTSLNFLISSPGGQLTSYSMTATYPGGSSTASGVNAIGEQLSVWVNVTGATRWDTVRLDYNYTTTLSGERTFTQYLAIVTNATASENTFMANKDRTFGLGIFERMLIITIIIIFTVGIATMVGQPIPGLAIGLFLYGFMVFTGFIPIWVILPSMLIGLLFLVWKSGGF